MVIVMYGPAIQEAIARGDLRKMKALRKRAQSHLKEYGNIAVTLEVLESEIRKVEHAAKSAPKSRKKRKTTKRKTKRKTTRKTKRK